MTRPPLLIHLLFPALYRIGLGPLVGKLILLLTTTGRKTGLPRVAPLQYAEIDGAFYLGGLAASHWVRNAKVNPRVHIQVGSREVASAVSAPSAFAPSSPA